MCAVVRVKNKELETPRQLMTELGLSITDLIISPYHARVDIYGCLCQIDVDKTLVESGCVFTRDCMDYKVELK